MRIVGIDVGEQGAHDGGHPRTHVFGGEAGKVAGGREGMGGIGLGIQPRQAVFPPRMPPRQHR